MRAMPLAPGMHHISRWGVEHICVQDALESACKDRQRTARKF